MKTQIVFTTINIPRIAESYCANIEKFGHKKDTGIIIIGDKKSPDGESSKLCSALGGKGFSVEYFDIAKQEKWLEKFPKLKEIIPYNSDNRRNIGYLMAMEQGCEILISVDDDNFPSESEDFVGLHGIVGETRELPVVKTDSGWFNICDLMENSSGQKIYARGYPYNRRWQDKKISEENKKVKVMLNAGLWLNDPDVDAITRINRDVKTKKFSGRQVALDIGTWSPINSQNTALHIDLLPAYYFVLMGEKLGNLIIDRYGDIWSGFFIKKVMDSLGCYVSVGNPVADHIRNKHNLFNDLKQELGCIEQTELLAEFLENVKLKGKNASDVYADLSDKLLDYTSKDARFSDDFKKYIKKLNYCQKIWLETVQKIKNY